MLKNLSYVSISFFYVNLLGYIFHFYVSRKLSPVGYGEFMVLYSLMLTVGNISNIFSIISVKTIVENFNDKEKILRFLRIFGLLIGGFITLTGIIISPLLKEFLKISYLPYIWVVSFCWLFMFIVAAERGYLQANDKFGIFAFSSAFELTVRLIIAIVLLYLGFYIWGAIFPSLFGIISVSIFLLFVNKNLFGKIKKISLKKIVTVAAYASPSGFFVYLDDIFIKRIFSPETAGYYASASILGKALIWFSITLFSVYFPKIIASKDIREFKKLCMNIIALIAGIFFISEFGIIFLGEKIFIILFGIKFQQGFAILPYYVISVLPLTISTIFIGINTAKEKYLSLIYLQLVLYLIGFIILKFDNVYSYISYIFILNFFFVLIYSYLTFFKIDKN